MRPVLQPVLARLLQQLQAGFPAAAACLAGSKGSTGATTGLWQSAFALTQWTLSQVPARPDLLKHMR